MSAAAPGFSDKKINVDKYMNSNARENVNLEHKGLDAALKQYMVNQDDTTLNKIQKILANLKPEQREELMIRLMNKVHPLLRETSHEQKIKSFTKLSEAVPIEQAQQVNADLNEMAQFNLLAGNNSFANEELINIFNADGVKNKGGDTKPELRISVGDRPKIEGFNQENNLEVLDNNCLLEDADIVVFADHCHHRQFNQQALSHVFDRVKTAAGDQDVCILKEGQRYSLETQGVERGWEKTELHEAALAVAEDKPSPERYKKLILDRNQACMEHCDDQIKCKGRRVILHIGSDHLDDPNMRQYLAGKKFVVVAARDRVAFIEKVATAMGDFKNEHDRPLRFRDMPNIVAKAEAAEINQK